MIKEANRGMQDGEGIDNPDQRIVADVESFTSAALNFIVVFLGAGMRIFSFGAILYNISMHLSVFLFFYAAFMTGAMTWLFGKRLAALNFIKRKCEADLRFSLVRVRENAESIAMYDGGNTELSGSRGLLKKMIENNVQVIWAMFGFEMFQNGTQYLTGLLPVLLVAPQYLAGEVNSTRRDTTVVGSIHNITILLLHRGIPRHGCSFEERDDVAL